MLVLFLESPLEKLIKIIRKMDEWKSSLGSGKLEIDENGKTNFLVKLSEFEKDALDEIHFFIKLSEYECLFKEDEHVLKKRNSLIEKAEYYKPESFYSIDELLDMAETMKDLELCFRHDLIKNLNKIKKINSD